MRNPGRCIRRPMANGSFVTSHDSINAGDLRNLSELSETALGAGFP